MKKFILFIICYMFTIPTAFSQEHVLAPYGIGKKFDFRSIEDQKVNYIKRIGEVKLDVDFFLSRLNNNTDTSKMKKVFVGNSLDLYFFSDKVTKFYIKSEERPRDNVLSLSGAIREAKSFSSFSMTITDESYVIFVRNLEDGILYRVVGEVLGGVGEVVEYDISSFPPIVDLPALVK